MTPHDVLLEAIAAASLQGDSNMLRIHMCKKLDEAIRRAAENGKNGDQRAGS